MLLRFGVEVSLSPAEKFVAAKNRIRYSLTQEFSSQFEYPFDEFQTKACNHLEDGKSVLVAAPTGAGKTIVGEFANFLALTKNVKSFYTTPIKALSNQKYQEFCARYGDANVGLLTGDTSINGDAPLVVMTTEVLRNMIYAQSRDIDELGFVIMDEVHYLADRFRGAVWEEILIHLPEKIQIAALSATVSNAEEFGDWLKTVRGDTEIVLSELRPVPLFQHILIGNRLLDLFVDDGRVNPEILRLEKNSMRVIPGKHYKSTNRSFSTVKQLARPEIVEILRDRSFIPAIFFIFSRAGCDAAVEQCLKSNIFLTNKDERSLIREIIEKRTAELPHEDFGVLKFHEWCEAAERGIAAHHAGLLPMFKETIEELFQRGLLKVVFATETLALGINMPARTVFLEKLIKWNGENHAVISPGEYTQLTGRAGRRGIDIEGNAIVLWSEQIDSSIAAGLASTRTYPLRSSFSPTYNMSANLISRFGRAKARESLGASFAQFQADRSVTGIVKQISKNEEMIKASSNASLCHVGDFVEYMEFRNQISLREQKIRSRDRKVKRGDLDREISDLRRDMKMHPCHSCPEREDHARIYEKYNRLKKETEGLKSRVQSRTNSIPRTFDKVVDVLTELDYVNNEQLTEKGRTLSRIYAETDLLLSEMIHAKMLDNLGPSELAAFVSSLVYEGRGERSRIPRIPRNIDDVYKETSQIWRRLVLLEDEYGLTTQKEPNFDLAWSTYRWANGNALQSVLRETDVLVGDFVRNMRQVVDLLNQLRDVRTDWAPRITSAIKSIDRGVVAYSTVIL